MGKFFASKKGWFNLEGGGTTITIKLISEEDISKVILKGWKMILNLDETLLEIRKGLTKRRFVDLYYDVYFKDGNSLSIRNIGISDLEKKWYDIVEKSPYMEINMLFGDLSGYISIIIRGPDSKFTEVFTL